MTKAFWKSKTLWMNGLFVAHAIGHAAGVFPSSLVGSAETQATVMAVANMVLRFFTNRELTVTT